ncbi:hypothetical protein DFH28DRAFT_525721 [Melampsora americana]|nr:hypothetical protein DFH28DRAFT_525721 [Melampsora americana]
MIRSFSLTRIFIWALIISSIALSCIAPRPNWVASRLGNGKISHMLSNYWPVRAFNIAMNGGFPKADRSLTAEFGDTDSLISDSQDLRRVTSALESEHLDIQSLKSKHLSASQKRLRQIQNRQDEMVITDFRKAS